MTGTTRGKIQVGWFCLIWLIAADRLVEVHGTNHHIMLILLSLRIRGSHDSTLALLKEMNGLAVHLIGIVHQWLHEVDFYGPGGLAYAHDFLIVNIA
jgi:hypothetical protein